MKRLALLLLSGLSLALPARANADVRVLYAGSLSNLMEQGVGPAFAKATHIPFSGFGGGSNGLANQIKGHLRRGDVFISANLAVNQTLMGPANGAWVTWYIGFAQSPLLLGYNPSSRFAADLRTKPWYQVLREPGIRIGRTDPKLDPKGALTVKLLQQAEQLYHQPGLMQAVLGAPDNPAQVQPEQSLIGRLQSGQIDVGFFYSTETTDLKIPALPLPPEVTLSAHYTATVLRDAADPAGAVKFIQFLLSPAGREIMRSHGLDVVKPLVGGNAASVPDSLRPH